MLNHANKVCTGTDVYDILTSILRQVACQARSHGLVCGFKYFVGGILQPITAFLYIHECHTRV